MCTLHVLNLPEYDATDYVLRDDDTGFVYVDTCLKVFANYVFESLKNLTSLVIGRCSSKPKHIGPVNVSQRHFVRGKLIDLSGHVVPAAIEIAKPNLQEMAPASDLLCLEPENAFIRYGQT